MKRKLLLISMVILVLITLAGVGVGLARPDLLPAWARVWNAGQKAETTEAGLYCKEHGVPEAYCTLCHEELKQTLMLCKEHGNIPEDICTLCHPEVEAKHKIEMCPQGHKLPKHFCVECGKVPSASAGEPDDGWCAAHNQPEATCAACTGASPSKDGGALLAEATMKACRQPLPIVRLATARLARRIGIATELVVTETHAHRLRANAETAYDANRYAEISPRVSGYLSDVRVDLGKAVRPGDVLAVVDSAEVSAAKTQLLTTHSVLQLAQVAYDRTKSLTQTGAVATKMELESLTALNQAKVATMDAEQRLRNLRFDNAAIAEILKTKDTRNLLDVVATNAGTVVARHAVQGEAVQANSQLFSVADTSRMWLWIDVYERDIVQVKAGQAVTFTISGSDPDGVGLAFLGEVTWVGTEVNPSTRTTRVRAELVNPNGRLRANQFGQAEIQIGSEHTAVVVPLAAVQRKDKTNLVFIPQPDGSYRPQRIVTKPTDRPDVVEVAWGLEPGERVVTSGSFLLKTEIMKGAIGAGCCE